MARKLKHTLLLWAALWVGAVSSWPAASPGHLDFNRDIRPVLSDNCFACHGPDEATRKAKLRLDRKTGALAVLSSGQAAVVPGRPQASSLIARVSATDPDDLMPPPKTGKVLTADQVRQLRRWIEQGADWPEHWAYVKPERSPLPKVENPRWVRGAIDHFVLARLEREGLAPSPEADELTLVRRASLDLTGLPPTVEEVDAYLADSTPGKYEALVDRLLASPRYGEHMARYWLDAVRYADSHGYHIDSQRDIWAYRDWVVNAFNTNQPFDRFTTEQIAGDLLPNPTTDQKVATGYLRCNMSTGEGGVIEAEYAAKYGFDRTETLGTVWMGLTLTCARCHTHKYDPFTQRDYYGLFAIFNQLDEPVMDGNRPNPDPFIKLPTPAQAARLDWLRTQVTEGETKVNAAVPNLDRPQAAWLRQWHDRLAGGWTVPTPQAARSAVTNGATLRLLPDHSIAAEGANPETDVFEVTLTPAPGPLAALRLDTLPLDSHPKQASGRAPDGRFQLSEFEAELVPPLSADSKAAPRRLKFAQALADTADSEQGVDRALDGQTATGWGVAGAAVSAPHTAVFLLNAPEAIPEGAALRVRLRFEASKEARALGRFRLATAQGDELVRLLNPPRFEPWQAIGPFKSDGIEAGFAKAYEPESAIDLNAAYPGVREEIRWSKREDLADGATHLLVSDLHGVHGVFYLYRTMRMSAPGVAGFSLRADDVFKVWANGQLVTQRSDPDQDRGLSSRFQVALPAGESRILVKIVNHQGAKYFGFDKHLNGTNSLSPDVAAIAAVTPEPGGDWAPRVRDFYRRQHSPEYGELFLNLEKWREEQTALDASIPTTLVAKELTKPRDTFLLTRGEYDKPGDKVEPAVPTILPPLPAGALPNRLGLARWLTDPSHPLTARVVVNRFWQQSFGIGLVKTTEDFGVQGERPSHPELLDWLATEFVQSGWDVKRLERLIVTSATYRQMAAVSPALLARDPENRLLARGPRFRLDAEALRDTALYAGGLLVDQRGGRSVKPYEPPGLWEAVSFNNAQKYVPDTGPATYRRSLYTNWKRQSPPPGMLIFDAPTREYCVVRRPRTNTPLQALALLNDPQILEASRALATRMLTEGGTDPSARLAYGFRVGTGRKPDRDELRLLRRLLDQQLAEYQSQTEAAAQLLAIGEFKSPAGANPAELAAWTTVANLILNLDETMTKG